MNLNIVLLVFLLDITSISMSPVIFVLLAWLTSLEPVPVGSVLPCAEHIFSVAGTVPEAVLRSSTQWLEPPGHPGHRSAANQTAARGFLSFSICREIIHENRRERNQVIGQDLSMASDTLQG